MKVRGGIHLFSHHLLSTHIILSVRGFLVPLEVLSSLHLWFVRRVIIQWLSERYVAAIFCIDSKALLCWPVIWGKSTLLLIFRLLPLTWDSLERMKCEQRLEKGFLMKTCQVINIMWQRKYLWIKWESLAQYKRCSPVQFLPLCCKNMSGNRHKQNYISIGPNFWPSSSDSWWKHE